jgi:phenylalanyl-tRNA synthetase beta chain
VGEGRKSMALRLEFRSTERTLTDDEVATIRERIKQEIATETGGSLRE